MKKISIFILTAFTTVLLSSCTDTTDTFAVSDTAPVVLSDLTITDIELDPVNINNPAITLNWTLADYGQQASINYNIQIASDEAFSNATTVATINGNNVATLSISELNSAAGLVGLPPFAWNTLYARVTSSLGTQNGLPVASNSINFNVYPYFNYKFSDYYLVGDATAPDWNNNNNNNPLFRDGSNAKKYYYTGYFKAAQFKVLETKGLWQPQWGTNDKATIEVNPGGGTDPGTFPNNNSSIATAGFYAFTIDFSSKTYTFESFDASGAASYTGMSIQGSASTTTAMTQSTFDSHIWYLSSTHLVPGNLQFKTNTDAVWAGSTEFSGQATLNGGNIPVVVEDDYEVWFNDLDGRYILIPLNL
ncbi:SusE domain-containing protein [Mariniflexile sp. AS56]|uniref:SusE domain-containing protein n=1 Tax=Mariniflexile sp. AS56 TaxID=3063957 RepID=UPI0026F363F2|nr:SusE domain-containing protein [Mariniflexile sp. AS56]